MASGWNRPRGILGQRRRTNWEAEGERRSCRKQEVKAGVWGGDRIPGQGVGVWRGQEPEHEGSPVPRLLPDSTAGISHAQLFEKSRVVYHIKGHICIYEYANLGSCLAAIPPGELKIT